MLKRLGLAPKCDPDRVGGFLNEVSQGVGRIEYVSECDAAATIDEDNFTDKEANSPPPPKRRKSTRLGRAGAVDDESSA